MPRTTMQQHPNRPCTTLPRVARLGRVATTFGAMLPLLACQSLPSAAAHAAQPTREAPSIAPAASDSRLDWWREARFGLFIHFGLYAIPAGAWNGQTHHGEWIRTTAQIPLETYEAFAAQFNPTSFDADAWVLMAKRAGMKYIVITTKHHDGFALFDSKVSDFDVMSTPFQRDIMRELADACDRHGMRIGWYHSIMDWRHPDYLPRREWETDRPREGADYDRFNAYLNAQVTELLTNYGPIGVMWFDGEWESTWTHERGVELYNLCRTLQPDVIVNNRVDVHRQGMAGLNPVGVEAVGDFGTPEQEVPHEGLPGVDWETCMTIHSHWGHNASNTSDPANAKSGRTLLRTLIDVASKGGNLLLNVGPLASGEIHPTEIERLAHIGNWMETNAESIHGTTASILPTLEWGRSTTRQHANGTTLYLHAFDWPASGTLVVPGLATRPTSATILGGASPSIAHRQTPDGLTLQVPAEPVHPDATVLKLEFDTIPIITHKPTITTTAIRGDFIDRARLTIESPSDAGAIRYTLDGSDPTGDSPVASGSIDVTESCVARAALFAGTDRVSEIAELRLRRVEPWPDTVFIRAPDPGLRVQTYSGDFAKLPDFGTLAAESERVATTPTLPPESAPGVPAERIALRFSGVISIPETGFYTFALTSDDGSRLLIDDTLVIDNDGLHAAQERIGHAPLLAGYHRVCLEWFNRTGGAALTLTWSRDGEPHAPIPAAAWGH
jgi:alpha-L-fucosidase